MKSVQLNKMSEYRVAPGGTDEESSVRSWRPPTPPQEEKKTWLSSVKNKIKSIADGEDTPELGDLSEGNTESASSAMSAVGLGYDESLLMTPEDSSFLHPNITHYSKSEYQPPPMFHDKDYNQDRPENFSDVEEQVRDQCSLFYSGTDDSPPQSISQLGDARFQLNQDEPIVEEKESWPSVLVPESAGVQADFRRSSLYQLIEGRVQLYLPTDNVRLLMDPLLEPGILLMVKDDGPITNTPSYVLTTDEHLYRKLVKEMAARNGACGFYFCCHESNNKVSIGVAIGLVCVLFTILFIITLILPH